MTMNSSLNYCLLFTVAAVFIILLHLLSPSFAINHHLSPIPRRGLQMEEKTRLGSRPPSCWNKCNGCHPCMPVQVPNLPNHNNKDKKRSKSITIPMGFLDTPANGYTNYKPLRWKCRCKNHLFNP